MDYEHLQFSREAVLTDRHRRRNTQPHFQPDDPRAFGADMGRSLDRARQRAAAEDIGGFDERLLLKVQLRDGEGIPQMSP
jgi:hypothetical protein